MALNSEQLQAISAASREVCESGKGAVVNIGDTICRRHKDFFFSPAQTGGVSQGLDYPVQIPFSAEQSMFGGYGPSSQQDSFANLYNNAADTLAPYNRFYRERDSFTKNQEKEALEKEIQWRRQLLHQRLPQPIPAKTPPPFELDLSLFPKSLAASARAFGGKVCIADAQALAMMLAMVLVATRGRYLVEYNGWIEGATLYMAFVSGSGSRKTQCISELRSSAEEFIRTRQEEFARSQTARHAEFEMRKIITAHPVRAFKRDLDALDVNDIEGIAALIAERTAAAGKMGKLLGKQPQAMPRVFFDTITAKMLAKMMSEQGECIACVDAEGAFITEFLNKKGTDPTVFLKGHNFEPYSCESVNTGAIMMNAPAVQMLVYTQPAVLEKLLGNTWFVEKGGAARILPGVVQESPEDAGHYNQADVDFYHGVMRALLERNFTQDSPRELHVIKVSEQAAAPLLEFRGEALNIIKSNGYPYLESFLRKLPGAAMRLATAIHCWSFPEPEKEEIGAASMRAGIALANVFLEHAKYLYAPKDMDLYKNINKIIRWIQRWGTRYAHGCFSNGDCLKGVHLKEVQIEPALEFLARLGFIDRITLPGKSTINIFHGHILEVNFPGMDS